MKNTILPTPLSPTQKRLMLLGGIRYLIPVIKAAHDLGIYVITADYLPDNIAHKFSDEYVNVSILDRNAVLAIAREKHIDGILSFGVDPGVTTAAYVAEKLGLPFPPLASVEILQNKDRFRDFLAKNGFNCPWHLSLDLGRAGAPRTPQSNNTNNSIVHLQPSPSLSIPSYPCIVKPVDSAGSKGCSRVDSEAELAKAIEYAQSESHSGRIIIEQFLEKVGHSSDTDSFSINNELVFCSFNCQHFDPSATNPYTPSGYTWPSDMPSAAQAELRSEIQRLIRLLNLGTHVYNIETRYCTDGKPYIMEVSPRGGGNRLSEILTMATSQDLIRGAVLGALGKFDGRAGAPRTPITNGANSTANLNLQLQLGTLPHTDPIYNGSWAEIIIHANRSGIFKDIKIQPSTLNPQLTTRNVIQTDLWVSPGDPVEEFTGANKTIGTLVLRFDTHAEAEHALDTVTDWLKVEVA